MPSLTAQLGASPRQVLWIADVYSLMMVSLVLVTGPLGDRLGHKRLLTWGLSVFGVASVCCAVAWSPPALIAGRSVLAVGASMIIPATLALVRQVYLSERSRSFAIGVWSAVNAGGAALGPIVGGVLLTYFRWPVVFLVNIPLVLLALLLVRPVLANVVASRPGRWEFTSPVLVVVGVLGVAWTVKDPSSYLPGILGVVTLVWFALRQLRASSPMLDLRLFASHQLRSGVFAVVVPVGVVVGFELLLTQHLQLGLGLSPLRAAVFLLPMPAAALAGALGSGVLVARWGLRLVVPVALGVAVCAFVGLLAVSFAAGVPMIVFLLLVGASYGVVQTAGSEAIMTGAPAEKAGAAAAIESVAFEFGAGMGIVVLGSVALQFGLRGATIVSGVLILVVALLFRARMGACRPPHS